ncbi:MAG: DJ-1/PfpI family protein [Maribacter sp.]
MKKNILLSIATVFLIISCQQNTKSEEVIESDTLSRKQTHHPQDTTQHKDAAAKAHDAVMKSVEIKEHTIKEIGILVYDGVNDLDAFGPRYIFKNIMGTNVRTIALQPGNVTTVMDLNFQPDTTIDQVDSLDILVIPGGFRGTIENVYNEELLQWIREIDKTTQYTTSVCTGGWILGKTGLLKGKKATGNWFRAQEMLADNGATFTNERYTQDGKYWTSAGVTAGMDMSLAILTELTGEDYAQAVMLDMEYDPKPPIKGGSVEKTSPKVLRFMYTMYSTMADPIFEEFEKKK